QGQFPMFEDLTNHLPVIASALAGLTVGWLFNRLASAPRLATAAEQLKAESRRASELEGRLTLALAEGRHHETEAQDFRRQCAELGARLTAETNAAREKQAL